MLSFSQDSDAFDSALRDLESVVLDPLGWPRIMQTVSNLVGAAGAVLLQSDARTADVPRTPEVDGLISSYFAEGWHLRDLRAERCVPRLLNGHDVLIDQDVVTAEEAEQAQMYKFMRSHGFGWFAVIGFRALDAHWGFSIQRTLRQGAFEKSEKQLLLRVVDRLTYCATLSALVSKSALQDVTNALDRVIKPALAIDRHGVVVMCNDSGLELVRSELSFDAAGRLTCDDPEARGQLQALTECLRNTKDFGEIPTKPIVVKKLGRPTLMLKCLPIEGAARGPFLGARLLMTLSDLRQTKPPPRELLRLVYDLTPSEARFASHFGTGISLESAAEVCGLSRESARSLLKAIFSKMGVHRQNELTAVVARL